MSIPAGTKFHGVAPGVDTVNKGSSTANANRDAYTIDDIGNYVYTNTITKLIPEFITATPGGSHTIVTTKNNNPRDFGVVKYKNNKIIDIVEKPKKFISDVVVTGLYAYENKCIEIAKNLKPSNRGELEISDLNNYLIKNNLLEAVDLGRGTVWFDAGTPDDLIRVSQFVKLIQESSKFEIANLNEVNNEFIKKK